MPIRITFIMIYGLLTLLFLGACQRDVDQVVSASAESPASTVDIPLGRLPDDVMPIAYQLELTIIPELDTFSGKTIIDLELANSSDHFYLHGKDLVTSKVKLINGDRSFDGSYTQVHESGIVKISSPETLQGMVRLEIEYRAHFDQALEGLYKVYESGQDYAFTQFQAISARKAFPGFDEPGFKTTFDITLTVPADQVAISNTPEISQRVVGDVKVVRFAPTKPLPTYLIAFAVGDFDVVKWPDLPATEIRPDPLPLRGIAVNGKGGQLSYALEHTNEIITALESYFGTPYPWAKLDILAVPDFAAGAMENVGAITYRESLLLFDEFATPIRQRRYKMVHAHELAHQWFGDLVTPVWWNDIWLNESFATWMAHVAMDMSEPEANYRRDLLSMGLAVMADDSLVNARQIRQPILSNNDISTAFDGITYSKGGAVLSMFENFLGRKDFRQGVRNYMQEFKYGAASADDFIRHLAAASTSQSAEAVMAAFNSFLEQPGLPLVHIESECNDDRVKLNLRQSRYLPLGSAGNREQQWHIPVCLRIGHQDKSSKICLLLTEKEQTIDLPGACPHWIIPNADNAGYYRFSMNPDDWKNLLANSDKQNTEETMAMLGSLSGAFNSGDLDIATLMSISPQIIDSPDWQVATSPIAHMEFMYERIASEGQRKALELRFAEFYTGRLDETGLDFTSDREKAQLQAALVKFLAETARQPILRGELVTMARAYSGYGTDNKIHADMGNPIIIGTALGVAVDELGSQFVDHLQKLALSSTDTVVRGHAFSAIGQTKDPVKSMEVLELIFSPDLRDNEVYNILIPQMFMRETRNTAWLWFRQNIDRILKRIPENYWGQIAFVGSAFCDTDKQAEVQTFFSDRIATLTGGPRTLAKALEGIELCVAKSEHHREEMIDWLGQ